jgi:hypothetical protein
MLEVARARDSVDVRIAESLSAVDELLRREEGALHHPLVEILTPDPIADVSFDKSGLLITSVELKTLVHLEGRDLASSLSSPASEGNVRSIVVSKDSGSSEVVDDWWKLHLWSTLTGETFAWSPDGQILQSGAKGWAVIDSSRWKPITSHTGQHIFTPPQPSGMVLVESDDRSRQTWLSSVTRDGVLASRSEASIAAEIRRKSGPTKGTLRVIAVTDSSVYVSVENSVGAIWRVAELDPITMNIRSSTRLRLPPRTSPFRGEATLTVSPDPIPSFLMISATGGTFDTSGLAVWQLSSEVSPYLLVTQPYFHSTTANLQNAFGGQSVTDVSWLPGGKILVGVGNDSLYVIDLGRRTAEPVFHPGDEIIKKRVGRNGLVAVFVQGGFKCYVTRVS